MAIAYILTSSLCYLWVLVAGGGGVHFLASSMLILVLTLLVVARDVYSGHLATTVKTMLVAYSCGYILWYFLPAIDVALESMGECKPHLGHCLSYEELSFTLFLSSLYFFVGHAAFIFILSQKAVLETDRNQARPLMPSMAIIWAALLTIGAYAFWTNLILQNPIQLLMDVYNRYVVARTWNEYYNRGESLGSALYSFIEYFSVLFLSLITFLWYRKVTLPAIVKLICLLGIAIVILKTFNRSFLLLIMAPSLIHLALEGRGAARARLKLLAFSSLVVLFATTILSFRLTSGVRSVLTERYSLLPFGRTNDFFWESALALRIHRQHGSQFDNLLWEHVTFLLPRYLFPDKPFPESLRLFGIYRQGLDILSDYGNVFPGIVGYFHLNYGYMGLLFYLFFLTVFGTVVRFVLRVRMHWDYRFFLFALAGAVMFINIRNIQTGINVVLLVFVVCIVLLTRKYKLQLR